MYFDAVALQFCFECSAHTFIMLQEHFTMSILNLLLFVMKIKRAQYVRDQSCNTYIFANFLFWENQ